jgi:hypothetical protein
MVFRKVQFRKKMKKYLYLLIIPGLVLWLGCPPTMPPVPNPDSLRKFDLSIAATKEIRMVVAADSSDSVLGYVVSFNITPVGTWYDSLLASGKPVLYKIYRRYEAMGDFSVSGYAFDSATSPWYRNHQCQYDGSLVKSGNTVVSIPEPWNKGTAYYKISVIVNPSETLSTASGDTLIVLSGGLEGFSSNEQVVVLSQTTQLSINKDSAFTSLRRVSLQFTGTGYDSFIIFDTTKKTIVTEADRERGFRSRTAIALAPGAGDSITTLVETVSPAGLITVRHSLPLGYGTKWVFLKLVTANRLDSLSTVASIKVSRPFLKLSIDLDSNVVVVRGNTFAKGPAVSFTFNAQGDKHNGDSLWVWLITPRKCAFVRTNNIAPTEYSSPYRYITPLGSYYSGLSPVAKTTKYDTVLETSAMYLPIDSSGVVKGTFTVNLDSVYFTKDSGQGSYYDTSVSRAGDYFNGQKGAILGSRTAPPRANFTDDSLYYLGDTAVIKDISLRPKWFGKKEFILVAYCRGSQFQENRIVFSDFSSLSAAYWDKYPPAFCWHPNQTVTNLAGGYSPANQQTKLDKATLTAPLKTWNDLENLAILKVFNIYLASGAAEQDYPYNYSVLDNGAGLVRSVALFIGYEKDLQNNAFAPRRYEIDPASGFRPDINWRFEGLRFAPIDVTQWQKGIYRVWVETEDDLGNRGMAPVFQGNPDVYVNPRYIFVDNGF